MGKPRILAAALVCLLVAGLPATPARAEAGRNGLIAFSRQGEVFTIRPDGTGSKQLTSSEADDMPLWSPDGTVLVVVRALYSGTDARWRVITMRPDGSDRKKLRPRVLGSMQTPEVSPDGTMLVYADMDLANTGTPGPYASAIRTLDLRTGARSRLTGYGTWNSSPSWSSDGTKIAFESSRDGDAEIYVMRPDGSDLAQVTHNEMNDFSPAWSPDGSRIAVETIFPRESGGDERSAIGVVDSAGGDITTLTEGPSFDVRPSWSPDGERILFSRFPAAPGPAAQSLWVMTAEGGDQSLLAEGDFGVWSPDGTTVAFARDGDLFAVPATGGDQQRLTRGPAFDYRPVWQTK